MLNTAFNQIRQYAEGSPSVMIRLLEVMVTINQFTRNSKQKEQIVQHTVMLMKAAERTFHENRDLEDMRLMFNSIKKNQ